MKMEITFELEYDQSLIKKVGKVSNYPPYDFIKLNDELYVLEIAVAGFKEEELKVELQDELLLISSDHQTIYDESQFLCKGIARRNFRLIFKIDTILIIQGRVELKHGILSILFKKKEALCTKRQIFPINSTMLNLT